ncbi:sigma-70 family RNA polymerase sigma factor [uncultured Tateyamaria sp.]|uniref:sigma-70 family RNA polymerase sigma factor n=1 Tax=uncultured Tateyamaria sp. TaxID=455651 RepID=UPI0026251309|nr:sigma-70 family RNA polymerase sigma factor [uncultured Tateyamaria sp.]
MRDDFPNRIVELLPNLRRYAISLTRQPDLADDLVQITVEKALKQRHQYDPAKKLAPWLLRILRNAWIDETRKQKSRGTHIHVDETTHALCDEAASAELKLEVRQTLEAIDRLPEGQCDVIILVCVEGLSYREAADVLDVAIGTVMSRLARGRLALAAAIGINPTAATYAKHTNGKTETPSR